ncbi:hypothetical protein XAPC_3624 [Xanthomonas citri pv. punicae str. LMG 859]|nr:hypothetical protein XAPC_3624 [Xanthomonas citri pv. punicae str. LMG 859]
MLPTRSDGARSERHVEHGHAMPSVWRFSAKRMRRPGGRSGTMRAAYTVQRTRARASRRRRSCAGQDRGGTVARSSG